MVEPTHYLAEENLSRAWARAFLAAMAPGANEISPLCVAVTGLDEGRPAEDADIRGAVDRALDAHKKLPVRTVASTIFPVSRWKKSELGHQVLFERYAKMLPAIKKADARNRNGTYFERMMSFGPDKINQLEHIIDTYAGGNRRRSALQAVIFDPAKDHTDQPQRGFPCLQYVSFAPFDGTRLRVTGVYATQYLFEKAYGNYLGLYNLGRFMAYELGLELAQLNCISSVAKRGAPSKESLHGLADELEGFLGEPEEEASGQEAVA